MDRRRYLRSVGAAGFASTLALSGCLSSDESDDDEDDEDDDGTDDGQLQDGNDPGAGLGGGGGGGGGGDADSPNASLSIDYYEGDPISESAADGYVEITHTQGDTIPAPELLIRGTEVYPRGDGRWDQQSTDTDGTVQPPDDGNVTAGVSVFVDVDSAFELEVVWMAPNSPASEILYEASGPEA